MWEILAIIFMVLAVFLVPVSAHTNMVFIGYISKFAFIIGLSLVIWCLIKIIREVYFYYKQRDKDNE